MKLDSVTISNVLSFGSDPTTVNFASSYTVLIGPNGGGKSNLLRIINVLINQVLVGSYRVHTGLDGGGTFSHLNRTHPFSNLGAILPPNQSTSGEPQFVILRVSPTNIDYEQAKDIESRIDEINDVLSGFRTAPTRDITDIAGWIDMQSDQIFEYRIELPAGSLEAGSGPAELFLDYLRATSMVREIDSSARKDSGSIVRPALLMLPPNRMPSDGSWSVRLSSVTYSDLLWGVVTGSGENKATPFRLGLSYFAQKLRRYERTKQGFERFWRKDPEVAAVREILERLGYGWDLFCEDPNTNQYTVKITNGSLETSIELASSGEQELVGLLMALAAGHASGVSVIVDEPELHLHPRWQETIADYLRGFRGSTDGSVIVATHASAFVAPGTINNVIRLSRRVATTVAQVAGMPRAKKASLEHVLSVRHTRRFLFADHVLLVEGFHDRVIMYALVEAYKNAIHSEKVIEVIPVGGKDRFDEFSSLFEPLRIEFTIMTDLDWLVTKGPTVLRDLVSVSMKAVKKNVLRSSKSTDSVTLAKQIDNALLTGELSGLRSIWSHIKGRHLRIKDDLTPSQKGRITRFVNRRKTDGFFILRHGTIEDYLPEGYQRLETALELIQPQNLRQWIAAQPAVGRYRELEDICLSVLESQCEASAARAAVLEALRPA